MNANKYLYLLAFGAVCHACTDDELSTAELPQQLTLTSEVMMFDGDTPTRANVEGNAFRAGDKMRLKIVCPFSDGWEHGETTNGTSTDAFFLLKHDGTGTVGKNHWQRIVATDGIDIDGDFKPSDSPNLYESSMYYEAQQTPYVYTAITWTEEKHFVSGTKVYDQYSNVFHADQSKLENYLASDLLWAQTYMQTGCWNIHLAFEHKMACLDITIPEGFSADAILTLQGVPDIDQAEVVVGDYYAHRSKVNDTFGYREKSSCSYQNHGRVIGVAEVSDQLGHCVVHPFKGGPATIGGLGTSYQGSVVPNSGVYTAYHVGGRQYRLIVPPCSLSFAADETAFWLRDGEKRYCFHLENLTVAEGKLYPFTLTK